MSMLDKIRAFFSGGSPAHDHDHSGHDHSHDAPTPEELAAAARAEPPTTTVEGLSEDEPSEPRDEVH